MTKYAILKYNTSNLGDEIQSIAAMQFLPRVDYYLDRDSLGNYRFDEKVKIISNGWFKHKPKEWPEVDKNLNPLIISIHLNKKLFNSKGKINDGAMRYLRKNKKIGCRDKATLDSLKNNSIKSYFSGCLTLTLKNKSKKRKNKIYLVDLDKRVLELIPKELEDNTEILTHNDCVQTNRFERARKLLDKYAQAKLVITSRLHCALPCLAYKTPVILVRENFDDPRFSGILELLNHCTIKEAKELFSRINWVNPEENKADIAKIRDNLIKICRKFINE